LGEQTSTLKLLAFFLMACTRKEEREFTTRYADESLFFLESGAL